MNILSTINSIINLATGSYYNSPEPPCYTLYLIFFTNGTPFYENALKC